MRRRTVVAAALALLAGVVLAAKLSLQLLGRAGGRPLPPIGSLVRAAVTPSERHRTQ